MISLQCFIPVKQHHTALTTLDPTSIDIQKVQKVKLFFIPILEASCMETCPQV